MYLFKVLVCLLINSILYSLVSSDPLPFMVDIFDTFANASKCGGSIITIRHVLTAFHCVDTHALWPNLMVKIQWKLTMYKINFLSGILNHFKCRYLLVLLEKKVYQSVNISHSRIDYIRSQLFNCIFKLFKMLSNFLASYWKWMNVFPNFYFADNCWNFQYLSEKWSNSTSQNTIGRSIPPIFYIWFGCDSAGKEIQNV